MICKTNLTAWISEQKDTNRLEEQAEEAVTPDPHHLPHNLRLVEAEVFPDL